MSSPESSPGFDFFLRGSSPLLQADRPRCEPIAGFPGSPSAVRRGTQRSSFLLCHVLSLLPSSLPAWRVSRVRWGWRLRRLCDLLGSALTSIRVDLYVRSITR